VNAATNKEQPHAAIKEFLRWAAITSEQQRHLVRDDQRRDQLLRQLALWQAEQVPVYQRLIRNRNLELDKLAALDDFPALATDVFRYARVASFPPSETISRFCTSGTTSGARGSHEFRDLSYYDLGAQTMALGGLFSYDRAWNLVSLIPDTTQAPDSSLAHMVAQFGSWFTSHPIQYVWGKDGVDLFKLRDVLHQLIHQGNKIALLSTSFALVMAEDGWQHESWKLPEGSLVMQTGGYKGKVREVDAAVLRQQIHQRYGVPMNCILAEYGMTELSSQLYEVPGEEMGVYQAPPWVRLSVVDPDSLRMCPAGKHGLLRIEDLANVDSCWAIQTSDRACMVGEQRVQLLGRMPNAQARGCSLMVEELMDP
jgi:hypothetical protein